jgi:hypothetical protein
MQRGTLTFLGVDLGKAGIHAELRLGRGAWGKCTRRARSGEGLLSARRHQAAPPRRREWEERSFIDEARVLSLPANIARVYDFFELEGNPYLVMEVHRGPRYTRCGAGPPQGIA